MPVDTTDHILNGDGLKAGLKQVIDERKQADLGADGLGRLVIGAPTATSVSLTEDAVSPFGFKLVGATSTLTGATVTAPSGSPPSMTVDLGATNPNDGDTIRFTFTLPDGTSRDLTLTATSSATPGPGQFTIGATSADTAANLQAALTQALGTLADTELVAASAVAAGNDFFNTDASQSAAARRRPAVRHRDRAGRRHRGQHRELVPRRQRHRRSARDRAGARRSVAHRVLRRAGQRAGPVA